MHYVYILHSVTLNRQYYGVTSNFCLRYRQHNQGSSTYTRKGVPWTVVGVVGYGTKKEAMQVERKLKNMHSRARVSNWLSKQELVEIDC